MMGTSILKRAKLIDAKTPLRYLQLVQDVSFGIFWCTIITFRLKVQNCSNRKRLHHCCYGYRGNVLGPLSYSNYPQTRPIKSLRRTHTLYNANKYRKAIAYVQSESSPLVSRAAPISRHFPASTPAEDSFATPF
jgi:hypothetical protein